MADDELLREAQDPTTPGERLEDAFRRTAWRLSKSPDDPELAARADALIRNPAMPLSRLARVLRLWRQDYARAAWHNPSVPLLLLREPLPEYRDAAARLLHRLGDNTCHPVLSHMQPVTLEALVEGWSGHRPPDRALHVQAFARHFAGLFGLPWPER